MDSLSRDADQPPGFATTRWSLVVRAGQRIAGGSNPIRDGADTASGDLEPRPSESGSEFKSVEAIDADPMTALNELCGIYWVPIYRYAIRRGHDSHEAQDLTQGFFASLLGRSFLPNADAARGRFRTYLLTAFDRFCIDQHRRDVAEKRGGGALKLPFDIRVAAGDDTVPLEPTDVKEMGVTQFFQRRWAETVLAEVVRRLRQEYDERQAGDLFDALKAEWSTSADRTDYRSMAETMHRSVGSLKVAAHRLRGRYRTVLRGVVAETVADPSEVDREIADLMHAFVPPRDF